MGVQANAKTLLEQLGAELADRGWRIGLLADEPPVLHVRNPGAPELNDEISCDGGAFRWDWGQDIGPVNDIPGVADRIMYVLREVAQ